MRNYMDEVEAAYLTSQRKGNALRDPERERSAHQDRRNRYRDLEPGVGGPRHEEWHAVDSYRPVANDYLQVLDDSHRGKDQETVRDRMNGFRKSSAISCATIRIWTHRASR